MEKMKEKEREERNQSEGRERRSEGGVREEGLKERGVVLGGFLLCAPSIIYFLNPLNKLSVYNIE